MQIHSFILTFNKSIIPKELKIPYCLERVEQYIQQPWGALNDINMDFTWRALEDIWQMKSVAKWTQIIWSKIIPMKLNAQIAK